MLPGFSGLVSTTATATEAPEAPIRLAGLWDIPDHKICTFARTDTFCTGLVLWCKEVYNCRGGDNQFFGHDESRTPYPCGVCVGVTNPSDW
jgi:hypothetical protein